MIRPLSAGQCERVMASRYGSHCTNPDEHLIPLIPRWLVPTGLLIGALLGVLTAGLFIIKV